MRVAVAFDTERHTFGKILRRRAAWFGECADGRAEHVRLGMRGRLVDAFTDALNEIGRANFDGFDKQRRCAILQIMKRPQIDVAVGIPEQTIDEGCYSVTVRLWE